MRYTRRLLVPGTVLLLIVGSAACHHRVPVVTPPPAPAPAPAPAPVAPPPPPPPAPPAPAPAPRPLTEDQIFAAKTLDQVNAEHPLDDAFFDYDSATLRPDAQASLAKDATWLLRWSATKVTISGHCDERGTAEYNLALGERRASAVKSYLQSLGVAADRMQVVSYGKERPFCTESNESCWQQNRRGHFLITAK
jgi:peptidoglycan-associated lipoprotein